MKPVSYHKIALRYLDLRFGHFGALALLKGTCGVFLVVSRQSQLRVRGNLRDVVSSAVVVLRLA